MSTPPRYIRLLHVPLLAVGLYNLYNNGTYSFQLWSALRQQGAGYLYLILMGLFGSTWLIFALAGCFLGNISLENCEDKTLAQTIGSAVGGAVISLFVPGLMLVAYFFVITWVYEMMFR